MYRSISVTLRSQVFTRLCHIILSAAISLLLLFGSTAKEFIHLFADHHDTVHTECSQGELSFESEHHHCDFLSFSLPAFHQDHQFPFIERTYVDFPEAESSPVLLSGGRTVYHTALRGPPAIRLI
ncbi:MAG: hypothetical protein EOP49_14785 [Sphingobacteriales bacterium]|nr:MAG: hypothetical protein EOP49_14785 [Sphingobacteriales bacterium]